MATSWTQVSNPATTWTAVSKPAAEAHAYANKLRQYYIQWLHFMPIQAYTSTYGVPIQNMNDQRTSWS
jgi:hypothetical protein